MPITHLRTTVLPDTDDPTQIQGSDWVAQHVVDLVADEIPALDAAKITTGLKARIVLTNAQIKSLNTVPVTIIAAPGATKFIRILGCTTLKDTTAGAYSGTPLFRVRYAGLTSDLVTGTNISLTAANKGWQYFSTPALGGTTDPLNLAIEVSLATDVTGGHAANYCVVEVTYTVITDGP